MDEDYCDRIEGREIISNIAEAPGLATMIATMYPDNDSPDELPLLESSPISFEIKSCQNSSETFGSEGWHSTVEISSLSY